MTDHGEVAFRGNTDYTLRNIPEKTDMTQVSRQEGTQVGFERSWDKTEVVLTLGKTALDFAEVDRIPRRAGGERETDVEHSYMLGLIAPELIEVLELPLDKGLAVQFATVHDLIELKTKDVNTFNIDETSYRLKQAIEQAALEELLDELPPYTALLLERYESQAEPEARFVKAVDKFLPFIVDIHGDGVRIMLEDNDVKSAAEYVACCEQIQRRFEERFGEEFPELATLHRELWIRFGEKFALAVPPVQDASAFPVLSIVPHTSS